jgi:DNA-binding CsgD family transcriptional regulator
VVTSVEARVPRALVPLVLVSGVIVLVTVGLSSGLWLANLHNALLALAFTWVGVYVLYQRPGHLTGALFMATGAVESVMFFGRQQAHFAGADGDTWWAWVGVWPVAVALGLVTLCVIFFPDGRVPAPAWRNVTLAVIVLTGACATTSALWPVEYASAGVDLSHPWQDSTPASVAHTWSVTAHPAYAALQLLWVIVVIDRWRRSGGHIRSQLVWLLAAAVISAVALAVGLIGWRTAEPGLLAATLVPLTAGWAIVHGQHLAAYSALTWLSRSDPSRQDLPHDLARAAGEALEAPRAALWMGDPSRLHAVGVWPETVDPIAPIDLESLSATTGIRVRPVERDGSIIGALSVEEGRARRTSRAEEHLLDDLASQASWVLDRQTLAELMTSRRGAGHLEGLTPREQEVLELMARGLSNAAIGDELHLSIKTVEPLVSAIFSKLRLHADADSNRRVLAVLAYLRNEDPEQTAAQPPMQGPRV